MPRPNNRLYDLLEVSPDVKLAGLRHAFRRVAERLEKRRNLGYAEAARRLEDVTFAFEVLADHEKRTLYDRYGEAAFEPGFVGDQDPAPSMPSPQRAMPESHQSRQPDPAPRSQYAQEPTAYGSVNPAPPQRQRQPEIVETYESSGDPGAMKATSKRPPPGQTEWPDFPWEQAPEEEPERSEDDPPPEWSAPPPPPPEFLDDPQFEEQGPEYFGEESGSAQARIVDGVAEILVPFRTACQGGKVTVKVTDRTHEIVVPAGIDEGEEVEINGVPVRFRLMPDRVFKRTGRDLHITLMLEAKLAIRGVEANIPTLQGAVRVQIPPLVKSGHQLRLKDKGLPRVEAQEDREEQDAGDLYVMISVLPPDARRVQKIGVNSGR